MANLQNNKAIAMLDAAAKGGYGVPAVVVYNLEGILATLRAAERKRSPAMLLLFPWAQTYSRSLLASLCAHACATASVPLTLHLDHAQSPTAIRAAADSGFYHSIMIDMSHHPHEENLRLTRDLAAYCHARGVATEAEPGRIEGGEDGISSTAEFELEGLLTTPEQAKEFVATGIDWLAPAFGNVHGNYGTRGIKLDYERLEAVRRACCEGGGGGEGEGRKEVRLVLHGTDGYGEEEFGRCVRGGVVKVNVNKAVNRAYRKVVEEGVGGEEMGKAKPKLGLTAMMEKGTDAMQEAVERIMDMLGSSGKA